MKFVKITGITVLIVILLAVVGVNLAFAQAPIPSDGNWFNAMRSMMNGNWQQMTPMHNLVGQNDGMRAMYEWMHQSGGAHDTVWNAMAKQLGLTSEDLTTQLNNGKTLAQLADEKGVKTQDLATTMETAMKAGLAQAVKDGKLTQAQAEQIAQAMTGQYEWMIYHMGVGMISTGSNIMSNCAGMTLAPALRAGVGNYNDQSGNGFGMMGGGSGMMGNGYYNYQSGSQP